MLVSGPVALGVSNDPAFRDAWAAGADGKAAVVTGSLDNLDELRAALDSPDGSPAGGRHRGIRAVGRRRAGTVPRRLRRRLDRRGRPPRLPRPPRPGASLPPGLRRRLRRRDRGQAGGGRRRHRPRARRRRGRGDVLRPLRRPRHDAPRHRPLPPRLDGDDRAGRAGRVQALLGPGAAPRVGADRPPGSTGASGRAARPRGRPHAHRRGRDLAERRHRLPDDRRVRRTADRGADGRAAPGRLLRLPGRPGRGRIALDRARRRAPRPPPPRVHADLEAAGRRRTLGRRPRRARRHDVDPRAGRELHGRAGAGRAERPHRRDGGVGLHVRAAPDRPPRPPRPPARLGRLGPRPAGPRRLVVAGGEARRPLPPLAAARARLPAPARARGLPPAPELGRPGGGGLARPAPRPRPPRAAPLARASARPARRRRRVLLRRGRALRGGAAASTSAGRSSTSTCGSSSSRSPPR